MESRKKCAGKTKKGKQCSKNTSSPSSLFCHLHDPNKLPPIVPPDDKRCDFIFKCKKRCSSLFSVIGDGGVKLCKRHDPNRPKKIPLSDEMRCSFSKDGKRCKCKIYSPNGKLNDKLCKKHYALSIENIRTSFRDESCDKAPYEKYDEWSDMYFRNDFLNYFYFGGCCWTRRQMHHSKLDNDFRKNKNEDFQPSLKTLRYREMYIFRDETRMYTNSRKIFWVYEKTGMNYFVMLFKNIEGEHQLAIYDRKKCKGDSRIKEFTTDLPIEISKERDRLCLNGENLEEEKVFLSVERRGIITEDIVVDIKKRECSLTVRKKNTLFYTPSELRKAYILGEYAFVKTEKEDGMISYHQTFTDTGLRLRDYDDVGKLHPYMIDRGESHIRLSYVRNKIGFHYRQRIPPQVEIKHYLMLNGRYFRLNFNDKRAYVVKIVEKGDPIRILNLARYIDLFSKKISLVMSKKKYSIFVIRNVIVTTLLGKYSSSKSIT